MEKLLEAIGFGMMGCQRKVWSDVWANYLKAREAITGSGVIPLGDISDMAVLYPCNPHLEQPNYLALGFDVFGALARNPCQSVVIRTCDMAMRGALEAQIVVTVRDVAALLTHVPKMNGPVRESFKAVLDTTKQDLQQLRVTQLAVVWDASLLNVVVNGEAHQVAIESEVDDGVKSNVVRTPAPCPSCGDRNEWTYGAIEGQLVCECGATVALVSASALAQQEAVAP